MKGAGKVSLAVATGSAKATSIKMAQGGRRTKLVEGSDKSSSSDLSPSVARPLQVLGAFTESEASLSFSQLRRSLDIAPTTLQRILATLEEAGYLVREREHRRYQLGFALVERGRIAQNVVTLRQQALPFVEELAEKGDGNGNLGIMQNRLCYLVLRVNRPNYPDPNVYVGRAYQMHGGSLGKAMLAWMPPEVIRDVLAHADFSQGTHRAPKSKEQALQELARTRAQGYGTDRNETQEGVFAVSAPVRGPEGRILGAIGLSRVGSQVTPDEEAQMAKLVCEYAVKLSIHSGFSR